MSDSEEKNYIQRRKREQSSAAAFSEDLKGLCDKYIGKLSSIDAASVIAPIMCAFDGGNREVLAAYGVSRVMDTYIAKKVDAYIPELQNIYEHLVKNDITGKYQWEYTIDGYAYYIPNDKQIRLFCIGRRTRNYLVFLKDSHRIAEKGLVEGVALHIRRIYEPAQDFIDEHDSELQKEGAAFALTRTEGLLETSDNVGDYPYVSRPDLEWFKQRDFELNYGDARDVGYVLSYGDFRHEVVEDSLSYYNAIKDVFFWIDCTLNAIEEENDDV